MKVKEILKKENLSREDIVELLSAKGDDIELIREKAYSLMKEKVGEKVYYRGLLEFSNQCVNDCYYCGIRKSNSSTNRFFLSKEEIVNTAVWCAEQGYGSIVLQSGERRDKEFIDFVEDVLKEIKAKTTSKKLPYGLGITLCVGEQDNDTYLKFFRAGAHRYLLRIETTDDELFSKIHPAEQKLSERKNCLKILKKIGYLVGTGVMIGLPGQALQHLADDIMFFKEYGVDMIGMGPYIPHGQTPMKESEISREELVELSLKMIAVVRLVLKDVNIAATTALQAIDPIGREKGLRFGANIVMPLVTPEKVRKDYQLYDDKPCVDEQADQCRKCLLNRIEGVGRAVGFDKWGDPKHHASRKR